MILPESANKGFMKPVIAFDTLIDEKNASGCSLIDKNAANMFSL